MNVLSWNVNGLGKFRNNVYVKQYLNKFDVIGLLETWSNFNSEFDNFLEQYTHFDNVRSRHYNAIRNSGGVSVFIRDHLITSGFVKRIFNDFKDCIILFIKSSIYTNMKDLIMYFAYVATEGSRIYNTLCENNGILLLESNLLLIKEQYPNCYLYLAGDFNARTKDLNDFILSDSLKYLYNCEVDYDEDLFDLPRQNRDREVNRYGLSLIDLCCTHNVHIVNGRFVDDCNGNFTCIANAGHSVVDYHIVSSELFNCIANFKCTKL